MIRLYIYRISYAYVKHAKPLIYRYTQKQKVYFVLVECEFVVVKQGYIGYQLLSYERWEKG